MTWWSWMIVGAIFLGAELAFIDAQFYLVFLGSAALLVGMLCFLIPGVAIGLQWAIFSALAIISMVWFRRRIYALLRGNAPALHMGPIGDIVILETTLAPGASCQMEHKGSFWTLRNESAAAISAGSAARIVRVEGLVLAVQPSPESS